MVKKNKKNEREKLQIFHNFVYKIDWMVKINK